jgi:hypothetical protein
MKVLSFNCRGVAEPIKENFPPKAGGVNSV